MTVGVDTGHRFLRPADAARVRRNYRRVQVQRLLILARNGFFVAVAIIGAIAVYRHTQSDVRFAVRQVETSGATHTPRKAIEAVTRRYAGANLFQLDAARVQRDLGTLPWIRRIDVEKKLPDTLRIRITERTPIALLRQGTTLRYVDEDGKPFADLNPAVGDDDLPLAEGKGLELKRIVALLRALRATDREMYSRISEIRAIAPRGVAVFDRQLRAWIYAGQDDIAEKWRTLYAIAGAEGLKPDSIRYADLRFADRIVIKPN